MSWRNNRILRSEPAEWSHLRALSKEGRTKLPPITRKGGKAGVLEGEKGLIPVGVSRPRKKICQVGSVASVGKLKGERKVT